ncbi:hypothetical protein L2U69_16555 [Zavarzinia compransoris]|uniref:capsular polysaccharide biosynthesis protein n=1 Tax=Zavarzinia marina TaxID=2911065 RepID=UPI001F46121B|nr:hypothetical protein [Zavarzinia marina]MCF4167261.1 hypothetical protein [Zavarzinia marina]
MAEADDMTPPARTNAAKLAVLALPMFWRVRGLDRFLDGIGRPVWHSGLFRPRPDVVAVVGWGRKKPSRRAMRAAARWGLPFLTVEDGFLRSAGLGVTGTPPLSIVLDDRGVHYEAAPPSAIEDDLAQWLAIPPADIAAARALIETMRGHLIGKYNDAPDLPADDPAGRDRPLVLVVDQTRGDASITGGGVGAGDFIAMLEAAVAENPGAELRVKVHPDVLAGKRAGFLLEAARERGIALETRPVSWPSLARRAARVYVATSLAGMEALIQGVPVTCFGLPFFAGWGLTDDRRPAPWRSARPTLEAVVAAAYVRACRYRDPLSGGPATALDIARHVAGIKRNDRDFAGLTVVMGLRPWKHARMRRFLASRWGRVRFAGDVGRAVATAKSAGGRVAVWAARAPAGLADACAAEGVPLWRIEDGFLRSVGLGSDHVAAASLVIDRQGIYFDPTRPSDLESLLEESRFDDALLAEAARLRRVIVERGLTKYNVGRAEGVTLGAAPGQRRILVPGQVEDDASVQLGAPWVGGNLGLLKATRAAAPDAWIVYKPHPDVEAGNRQGAVPHDVVRRFADQIVIDTSVVTLFDLVDEVHTMSSLVGFEALMRGLKVTAHGQPFYAGWGLTTDLRPLPRRRRRLALDELVAGALLLYPRYCDPESGLPCDVWHVVDMLSARRPQPARGLRQRAMRGLRLAGALLRALIGGR